MSNFQSILNQYDYQFPPELIAQAPASPRESARLLVYNRQTQTITHSTFANLADYLPENAVLVFNQTKVIPARFTVTKPTGGKTTLLYLSHDSEHIKALSDHKLQIGDILTLDSKHNFTATNKPDKFYLLKPNFPIIKLYQVLTKIGTTPIPPYIKNSPLTEPQLRTEYQSVFAKDAGSAAAPTASLHFSEELLTKLKNKGIEFHYITLHVGLGTFSPLTEDQIKTKKLHSEHYSITQETATALNEAKIKNRPIIAVGSTSVRALESASNDQGKLINLEGNTTIFIEEDYKFKFVTNIITNFHVPKSSLLMLVAAFTGRDKLMQIYQEAIQKKYRLFSFGDGMLIL